MVQCYPEPVRRPELFSPHPDFDAGITLRRAGLHATPTMDVPSLRQAPRVWAAISLLGRIIMAIINGTTGNDNALGVGTATAGNDSYNALDGQDFLFPSSGNDTLNGGAGPDTAIYDASAQLLSNGVTINNTTAAIGSVAANSTDKRGFGTDVLIGMESFHGTNFDDQIYLGETSEGSYTIDRAGDDLVVAFQGPTGEGNYFVAGPGNDTYVGSLADNDQIDYSNTDIPQTQGINVVYTSAGAGTATDSWGDTDTFSGIERITGTAFADRIIMGAENRSDVMGGAGNDTLDGGAGTRDRLRYDREAERGGFQGVNVNLATGTASDSYGNTDTISNFEEVNGTDFNDTLRGNDQTNEFSGNRGNDLMEGGLEEDFFRGGEGNDTINGGEGGIDDFDRVQYGDDAEDPDGQNGVVVDLAAGTATDGYGDTDTLIGIENASGTQFADLLRGDDDENGFDGGGHADRGSGRRFLRGGCRQRQHRWRRKWRSGAARYAVLSIRRCNLWHHRHLHVRKRRDGE
jgi:Ca2+-binding RTX toxin-like protein